MSGDLSRDELVTQGHVVLDWIATYFEHPERYPVLSSVQPGDIRKSLPLSPPAGGESLETILRDFEAKIIPGITHWNHPAFFAYFACQASPPRDADRDVGVGVL